MKSLLCDGAPVVPQKVSFSDFPYVLCVTILTGFLFVLLKILIFFQHRVEFSIPSLCLHMLCVKYFEIFSFYINGVTKLVDLLGS